MVMITYTLLGLYFLSNSFVFRFQRTSLTFARLVAGSFTKEISIDPKTFQIQLTPIWIGVLGWMNTGLAIILGMLIFYSFGVFGVLWTASFILYVLLGTAVVDMILPAPTHKQCARIIKHHLEEGATRGKEEDRDVKKAVLATVSIAAKHSFGGQI